MNDVNGGTPVLSVLLMAYNHEKYIAQAIESVLMQVTDFSYEIIIHDDASTDNTPRIICKYAAKYPKIIFPICQTENQLSKGKEPLACFLLPKARGRYLAFLECDDMWCDVTKIQRQVSFLEDNTDYSGCVHNSRVLKFSNGVETGEYLLNFHDDEYDFVLKQILDNSRESFQIASVVCRKNVINKYIDFFLASENTFGDMGLRLDMFMAGKIHYFPDIMSIYRWCSTEYSYSYKRLQIETYELDYLRMANVEKLLYGIVDEDERRTVKKSYKKNMMSYYFEKRQWIKSFQYLTIEGISAFGIKRIMWLMVSGGYFGRKLLSVHRRFKNRK